MNIGNKIRNLRKSKKITLKKLSEASGVALATLSRIETGKMTGTIKSHQAIASALSLGLPQLYGDTETADKSAVDFQSIKNRTELFVHNDKASYNILTNNVLSKKMMPMILKVASGGMSSPEELPKGTEKFIYIIKGECDVCVGSNTYTLKKGETLYFDASVCHHLKNTSNEEMRAVCTITPPAL